MCDARALDDGVATRVTGNRLELERTSPACLNTERVSGQCLQTDDMIPSRIRASLWSEVSGLRLTVRRRLSDLPEVFEDLARAGESSVLETDDGTETVRWKPGL